MILVSSSLFFFADDNKKMNFKRKEGMHMM